MPKLINRYGDKRVVTTNGHGIDIASQRADDLDKLAIAHIQEEIKKKRQVFALDAGCGHGGQSARMCKAGAFVVAMDANDYRSAIQDSMLRERVTGGIVVQCASVEDEPDLGTFDVILCQRMLHYLPNAQARKTLEWFSRCANPSAHLYISASGLDSELGDQYSARHESVASRFAPLAPHMADKHAIFMPVCLYRQEELTDLVAASGWTPLHVYLPLRQCKAGCSKGARMSSILIIGSAHLDILARARTRDDVLDRVGDISIEVGGTAANIAINIAHAGATARFLTALSTSTYSRVISEYLAALGVEMHVDYLENLPNGGFSAHINTQGEMVSAVSSTPIDRVNFDPQRLSTAMLGTKAIIIDCNLSSLAINRIVTLANDHSIPVYITAVSEEKCARVADVLGRVKGLFLNQKEYNFFCREVLRGEYTPAIAAKKLNCMIVLTRGADGDAIARPGHPDCAIPSPPIDISGSRLGMGDALAAGLLVLLHEVHGLSIREAAVNALKMVAWVGAQKHCHPGKFGAFEAVIDKYQHHAGHDAMTGMLNRHSCEQALNAAFDRRQPGKSTEMSVLMIDIDHFKGINDTFGHSKGDDVIVGVAQAIQGCLRETDSVGRWGGEEFLVVLPNTPREGAVRVAERIRKAVESHIHEPRQVTVSIGCSVVEHGTMIDSRSLVEQADAALYAAKNSGRNRVVCASA